MEQRLYVTSILCLSFLIFTIYRGINWSPKTVSYSNEPPDKPQSLRVRRQATINSEMIDGYKLPALVGLRYETSDREPTFDEDGVPKILVNSRTKIRIFGSGILNTTEVSVTQVGGTRGQSCFFPYSESVNNVEDVINGSARVIVILPQSAESDTVFYLCLKDRSRAIWTYASNKTETWLQMRAFHKLLPLWLSVVIIIFLLLLSGLFSGLNLGLMALDRTELKIVSNTGTETERRHAKAIEPVRAHGNYLLCSLLLGNVLVNSTLTILMDDLTSGPVAVFGSTIAIVIFGEIVPQAICSRHGLAVGARTVYITKVFMGLTFPLSYPISLLLDRILGEEIGNVYNRERLKELIRVTRDYNDLNKEEVNIISGALEMQEKTVADIMTRIDDAFMLSQDTILDFETLSEIREQGYSRIPIHQTGERTIIVGMLYTKDLAFIDSRLNLSLDSFIKLNNRDYHDVWDDCRLNEMLKKFIEGDKKGHMAVVRRVVSDTVGDPFYQVVGLVTLEDVIEEMIKAEIVDETDLWTDNRTKKRRNRGNYEVPHRFREEHLLSPQLSLAAFQYLSTCVPPFSIDYLSSSVLKHLLDQDVNRHIEATKRKPNAEPSGELIYEKGKPADYYVLTLEGSVEVNIGSENMVFVGRPFTSFGTEFLLEIGDSPLVVTPPTVPEAHTIRFIPDYSVRAKNELTYIRVPISLYIAAVRATKIERLKEESKSEEIDLTQFMLKHSEDIPTMASPASEVISNGDDGQTSEDIVVIVQSNNSTLLNHNNKTDSPPPSSSPTESDGLLPANNITTTTKF